VLQIFESQQMQTFLGKM